MPLCDCMSSKKAKYQFSCRVVHVHDYCVCDHVRSLSTAVHLVAAAVTSRPRAPLVRSRSELHVMRHPKGPPERVAVPFAECARIESWV